VALQAAANRQAMGIAADAEAGEQARQFDAQQLLSEQKFTLERDAQGREYDTAAAAEKAMLGQEGWDMNLAAAQEATEEERKFKTQALIKEQEFTRERDAQRIVDEMKTRDYAIKTAELARQKMMDEERESRRGMDHTQMQDNATWQREISQARNNENLSPEAQDVIVRDKEAKIRWNEENPQGPINDTTQEDYNSRKIVDAYGQELVRDSKGDYKVTANAIKDQNARRKLNLEQADKKSEFLLNLMEKNSDAGEIDKDTGKITGRMTQEQMVQLADSMYGTVAGLAPQQQTQAQPAGQQELSRSLPEADIKRLEGFSKQNNIAPDVLIQTINNLPQELIDEGAKEGKTVADIVIDAEGAKQGASAEPAQSDMYKTWDELSDAQQEKVLKKFRVQERRRVSPVGVEAMFAGGPSIGLSRGFKRSTEKEFIARVKANSQWLQDNFIKVRKEGILPETWQEATAAERRTAYNNYSKSVEPGKVLLGFAEFAKLLRETPEDLKFYLQGETNSE